MLAATNNTILIVTKDPVIGQDIQDALEAISYTHIKRASSFEEALDCLLANTFALVITEMKLPDLSGLDLLNVIGKLRPGTPTLLIDDDLSAKSAIAAFRLGVVDYMSKPVKMNLILIQTERILNRAIPANLLNGNTQLINDKLKSQERRINPETRAAGFVFKSQHFKAINDLLGQLIGHISATFIGLLDGDNNIVGAKGKLDNSDLIILKKALAVDRSTAHRLAGILEERRFHSNYYQGEQRSVFIFEFSETYSLTMVIVCQADVKPGSIWLYAKRTAEAIEKILQSIKVAHPLIDFSDEKTSEK